MSESVERFSIQLGPEHRFSSPARRLLALSPDGRLLVYQANEQLYLRRLGQLQAMPIPGTQDGRSRSPFISPDDAWIGFDAGGQLKKIAVSGGAAVAIADVGPSVTGVSWGADDMILFGRREQGIWRVPAAGGTPEALIEVAEGEVAYGPQMLPGGESVLFTLRPAAAETWNEAEVVVQSLVGGDRVVLVEGGRDARYVSTGHLVYALAGVLLAVPFDVDTRAVVGGPVPLVDGVAEAPAITGASHFDISDTGSLAYIPTEAASVPGATPSSLVWVDRQGQAVSQPGNRSSYGWPRLSPDDRRAVFADAFDIWVLDLESGVDTRLTDGGVGILPSWTPDGSTVTFTNTQVGGAWEQPADGSAEPVLLVTGRGGGAGAPEWTPDGHTLAFYVVAGGGRQRDLWMWPRDGDPEPFLATAFNEVSPRLSPDGRWVAYVSDQAGDDRVYVQPFPDGGQVIPISAGTGTEPAWSRDGRELFYRNGTQMFVAEISTEPVFAAAPPRLLFDGPYAMDPIGSGVANFDVSLNGERFLMVTRRDRATGGPTITLVQNWHQELLERVPVN